MSGNSPKDAYAISTPTATIAVRGTEFDIAIENGGTTRVANFEGETHICPKAGGVGSAGANCVDAKDPCGISVVRPTGRNVMHFGNEDQAYRNRQLKYYFPYVRSQDTLLNDFRVDLKQCNLAGITTVPNSLSPALPSVAPPPGTPTPAPVPPPPSPPSVSPPGPPSPGSHGGR
jgi:hypothetical protein